jgi:hypothetical protein
MSWRLRRSKSFGPFRFTLTKRGITPSVGVPGLRFSAGRDGRVRRTLRIPDTGLYDTETVGTWRRRRNS